MNIINYIPTIAKNQPFIIDSIDFDEEKNYMTSTIKSVVDTSTVFCPRCNGKVYIYDNYCKNIKDVNIIPKMNNTLKVRIHRYRCLACSKTFTEDLDFVYPKTRITKRMALWVKELLLGGSTISAVSAITGLHWNTICKIHKNYIENVVDGFDRYMKRQNYRPKFLAVDEFAIHKGHTYATSVMDLETGEILWVGKGRSMEDFRKFFKAIEKRDKDMLSEVKAFAMDMNASYNRLVEEYLPDAAIVYDRYHVQSQFGKDVLGSVRIESAKRHKAIADSIKEKYRKEHGKGKPDVEALKKMRAEEKEHRRKYSRTKSARWIILKGKEKLDEITEAGLNEILLEHEDLSVCYAMKEDMREIFALNDPDAAQIRWQEWFKSAKESGIPQLMKFAHNKEKRIEGLINHARYGINTGKLEGFNNRIKVAKRIAYGYRNDEYFFTLIRYISLNEGSRKLYTEVA